MSQTASKASGSSQEARTQVGVGQGTNQTFQRVVGRLNRSVLKTKRTYGFCTGQGVLPVCGRQGVGRRVAQAAGLLQRARQRARYRDRLTPALREAPLPLPPTAGGAGVNLNFSPLFPAVGFSLLFATMGFSPTID
jgi:hypothetical protein